MDKLLNKYAELVVRTGVNLQPQQLLVINSPIECSDFARRVAEAAFEAGAKDVSKINDAFTVAENLLKQYNLSIRREA